MNLDTMQLLGYTQYYLNLTKANGNLQPHIQHTRPALYFPVQLYSCSIESHSYSSPLPFSVGVALHRQGKDAEVQFEVSYSSEEEYQLDTLTPESLSHLAKR